MEKIIFEHELPMKLPSLNEYIAQCRSNRYQGASFKRKIENEIMNTLWYPVEAIKAPVFIEFVWHEKNRRRDKDNVAFAKKFILDAFQKMGVLVNDNNHYIAGFRDIFIYDNEYKVEIIFKEVLDDKDNSRG